MLFADRCDTTAQPFQWGFTTSDRFDLPGCAAGPGAG